MKWNGYESNGIYLDYNQDMIYLNRKLRYDIP